MRLKADWIDFLDRAMGVFGHAAADILDESSLNESVIGMEVKFDADGRRLSVEGAVCKVVLSEFFLGLVETADWHLRLSEPGSSGRQRMVMCFVGAGGVTEVLFEEDHDVSFHRAEFSLFRVDGSNEARDISDSRKDHWMVAEAGSIATLIREGIVRLGGEETAVSLVLGALDRPGQHYFTERPCESPSDAERVWPFQVLHRHRHGDDAYIVCGTSPDIDALDLAVSDPDCYELALDTESVEVVPLPTDLAALLPSPLLRSHLPTLPCFKAATLKERYEVLASQSRPDPDSFADVVWGVGVRDAEALIAMANDCVSAEEV